MKGFMSKYWKIAVVVFVIGVLVGIFVCVPKVEAGMTAFETGFKVDSDFTDMRGTSTSDTRLYVLGEMDFKYFVIDFEAKGGWDNGEFMEGLDGKAGVYGRLYKRSGLELMCGFDQYLSASFAGESSILLDDVRTVGCKIRKPL